MDSIDHEEVTDLDVAQLVERLTVVARPLGLPSYQPAIGSIPIVEMVNYFSLLTVRSGTRRFDLLVDHPSYYDNCRQPNPHC